MPFFLVLGLLFLGPISGQTAERAPTIPFYLRQKPATASVSVEALVHEVEEGIFLQTVQLRAQKKVPALLQDPLLAAAARDHAQDMLKRKYLAHVSPEKKSVVDRVKRYLRPLRRDLGENLHMIVSARGLSDPQAVSDQMMDDWTHSPPHYKNLVALRYRALGVGCASDGKAIYCVQVFASPQRK